VIDETLESTLKALYKALVAPRRGRSPSISRGDLLDRVMRAYRANGANIERGKYIRDMLFDAVASAQERTTAIQVLSFATEAKDAGNLERDAGYFLYGVDRVGAHGICVMQPPVAMSSDSARRSYGRVSAWLEDAHIKTLEPSELGHFAATQGGRNQLPLVMST
jgi:hypothetical protein